jgi:hypothetical protein
MSGSRKTVRVLFMFGFTVIVYLLVSVFCHTATAKADEVLMVGGANIASIPGAQNGAYMPAIFNGELCKGDNHCTVMPFDGGAGVLTSPNDTKPLDVSVAEATDTLVQTIKNTPGPKIAVAVSAGAPVVEEAVRRLENDPNGPTPNELSVVLAGPIDEGIGKLVPEGTHLDSIGYTVEGRGVSKYPTTVVTQQYDGLSTVPPDPATHMLAAANTAVGGLYSHVGYFTTNLNDPNNQVTQVGNEKRIVIPNRGELPLTEALQQFGQPGLADAIRAPLEADLAAVKQTAGDVPPATMSPQQLDGMLTSVSPMFAQGIGQQTDNLVNQLAPIFAQDPQMMQYIPPALLEDIPAPPTADVAPVNADQAPAVVNDMAPVQAGGQAPPVDPGITAAADSSPDAGIVSSDQMAA